LGNYDKIWEWIYANYDVNNYQTDGELLYDVKNQFVQDGRYFPIEAEDLIRERFQYRRVYAEMQKREDEQKQIRDFIGGSKMESLSDEVLDEMRNPRAEIMDIDMSEYATTREEVIPQDIQRFSERQSFFTKAVSRFVGFFRRK
jgi:hypothetical protein